MSKKTLALTLALTALMSTSVFAETVPTNQKVTFDGEEVKIQGYNINGNNYFKLRDVAALLKDTDASFNVEYNAEKNSVELTRDADYNKLDTDLIVEEAAEINSSQSYQSVILDGEKTPFDAYLINNNNYFKLRDLGKTIGFYVSYDEENNTVIIKSEKLEPKDLINVETVSFKSFAVSQKSETAEENANNKIYNDKDVEQFITADTFLNKIDSIALLSNDERQFSAQMTYNAAENKMQMKPTLFKIRGGLMFEPYLRVEQGEKREFFDFSEKINLNDLVKEFDTNKQIDISMGYYMNSEEKRPQDFRGLITIEFNK